jgi:hypothetical protein
MSLANPHWSNMTKEESRKNQNDSVKVGELQDLEIAC